MKAGLVVKLELFDPLPRLLRVKQSLAGLSKLLPQGLLPHFVRRVRARELIVLRVHQRELLPLLLEALVLEFVLR